MKKFLKKYFYYILNDLILHKIGFGIYRRDDANPTQFRKLFLNKNKNLKLIDCGAYHGSFTKQFIEIFPNSECLCFEPSKKAYKNLENQFMKNKNIHTYNIGLASEIGIKNIYINESDKTNSILKIHPNVPKCQKDALKNKRIDKVELDTLDNFLKKEKTLDKIFSEIDLIKIDVQGAELELLKGSIKTITKSKYILIEIHFIKSYSSSPLFFDIAEFLEDYNFKFQRFYELVIDNQDRTKMLYGDALFKNINYQT